MKRTIMAVAVAVAASGAHADSWFQFEAGIGARLFQTTDGRWYQQGIPGGSNVQRLNITESIGLTGPLISRGDWGIDWHVGYVNLGRAASDCACTPMDENYNASTHQYMPRYEVPMAYFTGSGTSSGVALTIEPYRYWQGLRWGFEVGAYVHHDTWSEQVYNWQVVGSGPAQTLNVSANYWAVAPVAGVSIGKGNFTLSYRHYFTGLNSKSQATPPLWNDADVIELKYKF